MKHEYRVGDALSLVSKMQRGSVELVCTSPPYWNLKDYEQSGQIGFGQEYWSYLESLEAVLWRCTLALKPGCKLCVNIGDVFVRASEDPFKKYHIKPLQADLIARMAKGPYLTFLGSIIWRKITTTKTSGGGCWMGSTYWPRDGYVTFEHEYVLIWKMEGEAPKPTKEQRAGSKLTKAQRSKWFRGMWDDIAPEKKSQHPAPYPLEIPSRLIRMFSFVGETVLDPFAGSGTTAEAALRSGRNSISLDLSRTYASLAAERVPGLVVRTDV